MRVAPLAPTSAAALLGNYEAELTFRRIVREIFPDDGDEILVTGRGREHREHTRVWAFMQRVESTYFPVYELDEYDQVACGIPFVRNGWSYERLHELDMRPGELLLFALCAQPFAPGFDSRIPLLDACEALVSPTLLHDIPESGLTPAQLHEQLERLRAENARLWRQNQHLRTALDAHIARARSAALYGPLELTAGTCVGPRRRRSEAPGAGRQE